MARTLTTDSDNPTMFYDRTPGPRDARIAAAGLLLNEEA